MIIIIMLIQLLTYMQNLRPTSRDIYRSKRNVTEYSFICLFVINFYMKNQICLLIPLNARSYYDQNCNHISSLQSIFWSFIIIIIVNYIQMCCIMSVDCSDMIFYCFVQSQQSNFLFFYFTIPFIFFYLAKRQIKKCTSALFVFPSIAKKVEEKPYTICIST